MMISYKNVFKFQFQFHGVGQGLFYSGSIGNKGNILNDDYSLVYDFDGDKPYLANANDNYNFVYDCGGDEPYLKNSINTYLNSVSHIDFLVVSHLHEDHIKGIHELFNKKKGPKTKVYLPYFDFKNYGDCLKLILLVNGFYNHETKDFGGSDYKWVLEYYQNTDGEKDYLDSDYWKKEGNEYKKCNDAWTFCFFNKKIKEEKLKKLKKEISNIIIGYNDLEECVRKKGIDDLATAYKNVFGKNINPTSLIMLHYPNNEPKKQTLLTGDAVFNQDLNCRVCKEMQDMETICQIPHHGAKNEWNKLCYRTKSRINTAVISYGKNNSYHHPKKDVTDDLSKRNIDTKHVTHETPFSCGF